MAVNTTTNKVREAGNNINVAFDFTFLIFAAADLTVYKVNQTTDVATLQVLGVDYTVAINSVTAGGTVTYTVAPTATEDSLIIRELDLTQTSVLPTEGGMPEKTVENMVDKNTMLVQQLQEQMDRSLTFSDTSEVSGVTLPEPVTRRALVWFLDGADWTLINSTLDPDEVATAAAASAAAAAVSAAAAAVSETNAATSETNAGTSETNAAASEALAALWATSAALVAATDYSSKEYAVGTTIRGLAGRGSAKDWATLLGTTVDDAEFSAKHYAQEAQAASKEWSNAPVQIKTIDYTLISGDEGALTIFNGTDLTATLSAIAAGNADDVFAIKNINATDLTIAPTGGDTVEKVTLKQNESAIFVADLTNTYWRVISSELASLVLDNDTYLQAVDNAGTGFVDLIKATTGDEIILGAITTLPDGSKLATSGAPTADAQIANKKYVDDNIGGGGTIKGWINFNGTGTIAIRDSFNVTSITDLGTGDYTVTWDTDFANDDYAVGGIAGLNASKTIANICGYLWATGSVNVFVLTAAEALYDADTVNVIATGDQA